MKIKVTFVGAWQKEFEVPCSFKTLSEILNTNLDKIEYIESLNKEIIVLSNVMLIEAVR